MATQIGTPGNDTLTGTADADTLDGAKGSDGFAIAGFEFVGVSGGAGADTLRGGSGDDVIEGGADADSIKGGTGDDTFVYSAGPDDGAGDRVDGGLGFDVLSIDFSAETAARTFAAKDPLLTTTLAGSFQVVNVERVSLAGGSAGDTFTGGRWDDSLSGGGGDDKLNGGIGADRLDGGNDDDVLSGGNGNDSLQGGDGNDTLNGGYGSDYLQGDAGNDILNGGDGRGFDSISITFGDGVDTIDGGAGTTDVLSIDQLSKTFTAKASNVVNTISGGTTIVNIEHYVIDGWDGANKITTGSGADEIDGHLGADTLNGAGGNDTIRAEGGGADTIDGGAGIDTGDLDRSDATTGLTYTVKGAKGATGTLSDGSKMLNVEVHQVEGGSGNDTFTAGTALQVVFDGGLGSDKLTGGAGADQIDDSGGNNTISAGAGADHVAVSVLESHAGGDKSTIALGANNDIVELNMTGGVAGGSFVPAGGTVGVFSVDGGAGTDRAEISRAQSTESLSFTLSANATLVNGDATFKSIESVYLIGGSGNDKFTGGALDDWLVGNEGRDTLNGAGGDDKLWIGNGDSATGGGGNDRVVLDLSALTTGVTFTLTTGAVTVNATTKLNTIETMDFNGTQGGDRVTGGAGADALDGLGGNDRLNGGGGRDTMHDGAGNDTLNGGTGNDTLYRDNLDAPATDAFSGGAGIDTLGFFGSSEISAILDLADQSKNDGQAAGLTVSQFEVYVGTAHDDEFRGSSVGETLQGGEGDDVLNGRGGNDVLQGGGGGDVLTGGTGKDQFVFGGALTTSFFFGISVGESGSGDEITDFTRGTDKLVVDAGTFGLANAAAISVTNGTTLTASGTKPQFFFETDSGRLWFDADGTGNESDAVLLATLDNVTKLAASDFLLG